MTRITIYRLLFLIIPVIMVFSSCKNREKDLEEEKKSIEAAVDSSVDILITKAQFESSGMELGKSEPMEFSQMISANGIISPATNGWAKVGTLIPGRVKSINFAVGDYVQKGQVLFTLEGNEVIELQQAYAEAYHQLKSLKSDYERQKVLSEEGIASQKNYLSSESDYLTLLSKVEGLKAKLSMINLSPQKVETGFISSSVLILAPINGNITYQELVLGEFTDPDEHLIELVDAEKLQLNIYIFEKDLNQMKIGQEVIFYNPDEPSDMYLARITQVGKSIDTDTKTIQCIAAIKAEERNVFVSGLFVQTNIITLQREVKALPGEAIFEEGGKYFVLSLQNENEEDMLFRKTAINVGISQRDFVEILDTGTKDILVKGGYNLSVEE